MKLSTKLPSISPSRTYAKINQHILSTDHTNTILALPLIYEFADQSSFDRVAPFFTKLTREEVILLAALPDNKCEVFPTFSSQRRVIAYLPKLLKHGTFSFQEARVLPNTTIIQAPLITYRSTDSGNFTLRSTDSTKFDMYSENAQTHYEIPSTTTLSFSTHLKTQLFTRYVAPSVVQDATNRSASKHVVLDSFLPFLILSHAIGNQLNSCLEDNSKHYAAISPFTAEFLNIERIPLCTILTTILGKDLDQLRQTILRIKAKKLQIIFAGVGGTGTNSIYWLQEILTMLNIPSIFDQVHIFEKDYVDFSNIFRFPIPFSVYTNTVTPALPKAELIRPYTRRLSPTVFFHDKFLETTSDFPSMLLTEDSKSLPNTVIYGAPSIANRNFLSSVGNFVSATHANNTASLYSNPIADETLQVETYGLIQLNSFFINQISMLLGFLDMLDTDAYMAYDNHFADYTFQVDTKASYNFNIKADLTAFTIGDD